MNLHRPSWRLQNPGPLGSDLASPFFGTPLSKALTQPSWVVERPRIIITDLRLLYLNFKINFCNSIPKKRKSRRVFRTWGRNLKRETKPPPQAASRFCAFPDRRKRLIIITSCTFPPTFPHRFLFPSPHSRLFLKYCRATAVSLSSMLSLARKTLNRVPSFQDILQGRMTHPDM